MPKYYRKGSALIDSGFHRGRVAGDGVAHDDYSEESGGRHGPHEREWEFVRLPHDGDKPENLNGPVIVVRDGKKGRKA